MAYNSLVDKQGFNMRIWLPTHGIPLLGISIIHWWDLLNFCFNFQEWFSFIKTNSWFVFIVFFQGLPERWNMRSILCKNNSNGLRKMIWRRMIRLSSTFLKIPRRELLLTGLQPEFQQESILVANNVKGPNLWAGMENITRVNHKPDIQNHISHYVPFYAPTYIF